MKEIHSKPDSLFKKKRSHSFHQNINITERISPSNNLNPIQNLKIDNYILNKKLGQGTFGIVVLAIHEMTGEKVAIKILDKEKIFKNSEKIRFERKIQIMKKMYHKNIVRLYNVIENFKEIFLVMEYIPGQELFDYITYKKRLDEIESCKFFQQIISGIEYLSKTRVAHRDLKPENLLLDSKKTIKIVDFGLSNTYYENELLSTACGSPCYAAPEILQGKKYKGVEVDIWSSGIILYAMLCGYLPFEDKNNQNLYKKIIKGEFNTPKYLSSDAVDFLHKILNVEPRNRFTIELIKTHPWFNMINPKINMSEGLLIDKYIIPFDEEIIKEMVEKYFYNEQIIKINLIINKHNHITTTYYLMLQKKIRNCKETIGDMNSKLFLNYIKDSNNLLIKYHYDLNKIIVERIFNKDENLSSKQNKENKNSELKEIQFNNLKKPEIKLCDSHTSNLIKNSNYNKKVQHKIETKYIKINHSKKLQTIESEKNDSDKKLNLKKINSNSKDKRNYISMRDNKNISKNKKKIKYYFGPKNSLSQKYFNSTFSENIKKDINQTNEDISSDENMQKKIQNRLHILKDNILKNLNLNYTNNEQKTDNNIIEKVKEINLISLSTPKTLIKSTKNNHVRYKKIKALNKPSLNYSLNNRIENKNCLFVGDIRIIKKRKDSEKRSSSKKIIKDESKKNNNFSKSNYQKKNFHINSTSRLSGTQNNILRILNNKFMLEQNSIKDDKFNNFVTNNNNNNNINININFTNIIKNDRYKKTENSSIRENNERLLTNYNGINDLLRLNKFLDNSIKNKKCFFNTSVSIEKGKRKIESENKYNRCLLFYSNNNKNLYDKYNRYNIQKDSSTKRKIKDNKYLQIKSKNKMFNNSKNNSIQKIGKNINISSNANQLNKQKYNIAIIEKKNTNINLNSKFKNKDNNNFFKISNSKKSIKEIKKKHTFKHLKTDSNYYNNYKKLSLTNFDFFLNLKTNLNNINEIKEENTNHLSDKKNKILNSNFNNNKKNTYLNPFDLNSIIIIKEGSDIRKKICNFLDNKNIKYKNPSNNKYICSKNDMELELQIININNQNSNRLFIIKSFHKKFKSIKIKNLYYQYISKLINRIR